MEKSPKENRLSLKDYMKNVEVSYLKAVVDECNGDKEAAAEKLGVSLATLYRKINEKGERMKNSFLKFFVVYSNSFYHSAVI
jgi:transcriptional regulator with PAS, ATPase and Fis domain